MAAGAGLPRRPGQGGGALHRRAEVSGRSAAARSLRLRKALPEGRFRQFQEGAEGLTVAGGGRERLAVPSRGQAVDAQQVFFGNVDEGIHLRQGEDEVFMRNRLVAVTGGVRPDGAAGEEGRVTAPGEKRIEGHRCREQDHHVQQHRRQHEAEPQRLHRCAAEHGDQRRCPAGRVDAAQVVHRTDRKAHRGRGRERRIGHQARAGDADQGRHQMPAEYRPGLRERAVRHGEHQHRGGPDRKNQQRRRRLAAKGMAGEIDRQHPDQAAERRYQPFTMADRTQFDTQDFLPRRWRSPDSMNSSPNPPSDPCLRVRFVRAHYK
jgi:hypothetical protein